MSKNEIKTIDSEDIIKNLLQDSITIISNCITDLSKIKNATNAIITAISNGNKIVVFGNGGSAADAQHIAGELVGRFLKNRNSYPAIALTTDTSTITAIANDFSYDEIFSRQCESLVKTGDVVIGISTSGNSKNVLEGLKVSKNLGAITIGLLGNKGDIKNLVDIPITVETESTPRIQEAHRIIYHIICQMVEERIE
jgi:D-sedoheptulose 7-phosphate isomerase